MVLLYDMAGLKEVNQASRDLLIRVYVIRQHNPVKTNCADVVAPVCLSVPSDQ